MLCAAPASVPLKGAGCALALTLCPTTKCSHCREGSMLQTHADTAPSRSRVHIQHKHAAKHACLCNTGLYFQASLTSSSPAALLYP